MDLTDRRKINRSVNNRGIVGCSPKLNAHRSQDEINVTLCCFRNSSNDYCANRGRVPAWHWCIWWDDLLQFVEDKPTNIDVEICNNTQIPLFFFSCWLQIYLHIVYSCLPTVSGAGDQKTNNHKQTKHICWLLLLPSFPGHLNSCWYLLFSSGSQEDHSTFFLPSFHPNVAFSNKIPSCLEKKAKTELD